MLNRGDIYGDGVNVAARLEALADPAGICVSESVRTAVGNRLNLGYDDIGKQEVILGLSESRKAIGVDLGR